MDKEGFLTKEEVREHFKQIVNSYGFDWNEIERLMKDPEAINEGRRLMAKLNLSEELEKMREDERHQ